MVRRQRLRVRGSRSACACERSCKRCTAGGESRLEGVNRQNLKFINLNTHTKVGVSVRIKFKSKECFSC
jgi:hypothetical protein